jgi:hypothetical protein
VGVTPSKKLVAIWSRKRYYLPMTPTEKQYAKNVGKLFIAKDRQYNNEKQKYEYTHTLCFVYGMYRTGYNGKNGAYAYNVESLFPKLDSWRKDYSIKCKEFNGTTRRGYWHRIDYLPATPENKELIGKVIDVPENE